MCDCRTACFMNEKRGKYMKRSKFVVTAALIVILAVSLSGCMTLNVKFPVTNPPADLSGVNVTDIATQPVGNVVTVPAATTVPAEQPTGLTDQGNEAPATNAGAVPATTPATPVSSDPGSYSNEQLLSWFNESLNKVKTGKPGFTKSKVTTIPSIQLTNKLANSVSDIVVGMLVKGEPEVVSVGAGESCDTVMSPGGKGYVSKLTMADITNISVSKNGGNYVVTVNVKDEVNPNKDNSAYGRVFDYLSKDDLINVYIAKINESGKLKATLPAENCTITMSGGTAVAEITPDGKVVKYETTLQGAISVSECSVKMVVSLSTGFDCVLKSVTTYTDFVW